MAIPIPAPIREHPYITVGAIAGGVILFMLISGSGGAVAATDPSTGSGSTLDPMAAINAQLSAASMQISAQKEIAVNENATKVTLAQLNADTAKYQLDKQTEYQEQALHTQEVLGGLQSQVQLAGINAQADVAKTNISANAAVTQAQTAAAAQIAASNNATQQAIAQQQAQVAQAQAQAQTNQSFFGMIGSAISGLFGLFF